MNTLGWLGLGSLAAAVTAGWGYIKALWMQFYGMLFISFSAEQGVAEAMLVYLNEHFRQMPFGPRVYFGSYFHVRSLNRVQLVAFEVLNRFGALYWKGLRPLWVVRMQGKQEKEQNTLEAIPSILLITFLRGSWKQDELVNHAVAYLNGIRQNIRTQPNRHFVKRVYGLSQKRSMVQHGNEPSRITKPSDSQWDWSVFRTNRPLAVKREDLGQIRGYFGVSGLALAPQALEAVEEARRWKDGEEWYREHGLPWRRSWQLNGRPGNGKTALARALSEELDLPVYIYDLASLANDELQMEWLEMLGNVPCMALIEDIDGVFDGRNNLVGELTFDCLLNCLDGIERADGLFVIITTNRPEKIDPALGVADAAGRSTRPGRVDRAIEMIDPDMEGRMKIVKRILKEWPEEWEGIVNDGAGETGAQVQERAAQRAMELYWQRSNHREKALA